MAGYIGHSRSVNSQAAIDCGLVSLNMINRNRINNLSDYPKKIIKLPVRTWKDVARDDVLPVEWHHTGSLYRKTEYYSLDDIAEYIEENYSAIKKALHKSKGNSKHKYQHQHYAVCEAKNFEHHPYSKYREWVVTTEYDHGTVKETPNTLWLVKSNGRKINLNANRIVDYKIFKSKKTYHRFFSHSYNRDLYNIK